MVPIATTRLRTLLEWLRIGPKGEQKLDDVAVFSRGDDEALRNFRTAWELTRKRAGLRTVRLHDFRSECATERYDRQTAASLKQSAEKLDPGEPFKNLSISEKSAAPVESASSTH
jgi:integrase